MSNFTECYITFTFKTHTFKATVRSWQALDDLIEEFAPDVWKDDPRFRDDLIEVDLTPLHGKITPDGKMICTHAGVWKTQTQNLRGRTLNGSKPALEFSML